MVGLAIWEKNGLLEKVFLFPKVATKFKDLHVCLRLPLKGFLCCASVVLQLADRKSSSFGSGGSSSLGGTSCLLDWVESNLFGLGVCFWASGQACLLWITSFVWFFVNKNFCFEVANCVCVCVCVEIESSLRWIPSFGGWNFPLAENALSKAQKKLLESLKQ